MIKQLPLRLNLRDTATFHNFYVGDNAAVINALESFVKGSDEHFIYVWGASGVGRTHLLQACCHQMQQNNASVMYLPLKTPQLTPAILQDIENMSLLCIDDIDAVLNNAEWEEALLHLYNRVRDQGRRLLIAGNELPARMKCQLADLRSRLAWGLVFHLTPLNDEQKIKALQMHAHERGIILSEEVGHFLLHHYPRDMTELFNVLNKLDHASLIEKRKLTIPFVKQVLNCNL